MSGTRETISEDILLRSPRPIAVVGGGMSRHRFGDLIDRYPTVIRLPSLERNRPATHVGTKTDHQLDDLGPIRQLAKLGVTVDLFCFGEGQPSCSVELGDIMQHERVLLFDDVYDYQTVYDYCHANHAGYDNNVGLAVARRLQLRLRDKRVLEFGAGNGELTRHLEATGNEVTAVEISRVAFDKIRASKKIHGGALDLALIDDDFDFFVAVEVLEHLSTNDVKMVVRQAGRLCRELIVTVSTRPSTLTGPDGNNLHLTVRPPEWWESIFRPHFDVQIYPGFFDKQYIIAGSGHPLRDRD